MAISTEMKIRTMETSPSKENNWVEIGASNGKSGESEPRWPRNDEVRVTEAATFPFSKATMATREIRRKIRL